MSHFLLDASILVQYVVAEVHTPQVDLLIADVGKTTTAYMPEFALLECGNVLWKQVRFSALPIATALKQSEDLLKIGLQIVSASDYLPRALEIGVKHQLAVYDSVYIAMAEALRLPLITDDAKQARAAEGVALKPITDFTP